MPDPELVTSTIQVYRFGFYRTNDPTRGPEDALGDLLRRMEQNGHSILSVSVLHSQRVDESYEAFVVSRHKEPP